MQITEKFHFITVRQKGWFLTFSWRIGMTISVMHDPGEGLVLLFNSEPQNW